MANTNPYTSTRICKDCDKGRCRGDELLEV